MWHFFWIHNYLSKADLKSFLLVHANNQYCGWASEILHHQKDSGMFTIYQLVDFAGPSTVWCVMPCCGTETPDVESFTSLFTHACCGWILHSVFDGGIRRLFVRPADGGCFSVGFNSKAGQLGFTKISASFHLQMDIGFSASQTASWPHRYCGLHFCTDLTLENPAFSTFYHP